MSIEYSKRTKNSSEETLAMRGINEVRSIDHFRLITSFENSAGIMKTGTRKTLILMKLTFTPQHEFSPRRLGLLNDAPIKCPQRIVLGAFMSCYRTPPSL
ncbi:hypothetical protein CEXT_302171 [Caerostris extrusa]|uniref:Uncharacterized protein n=1 Tax=Caerostris extrusa TaxID=172846 RepID=A0AAV4M689_CAEEX|nr:hypothetical protein CEXT_302171 [Caerostris extrusa]